MEKEKAILAYSGGLDTSVILKWLQQERDLDVIAVCFDAGQKDDFDEIEKKALKTGASEALIIDIREEFITDFIYPTLKAGAIYEDDYLLGTSMARPLMAAKLVEIAEEKGIYKICHGCTGKGNDQVRFETTIKALNPACRVFFAVRGAPVVNDVTEDDARAVGMDECAEVISNGDNAMGTVLSRASVAFRDIYRAADVVIAKGQANYECLSEEDGNVYFLLMAKCHVIADDVGVPVGGMVCMKNERRRSARRERMNGANQ